jgi:hypothetical protein
MSRQLLKGNLASLHSTGGTKEDMVGWQVGAKGGTTP